MKWDPVGAGVGDSQGTCRGWGGPGPGGWGCGELCRCSRASWPPRGRIRQAPWAAPAPAVHPPGDVPLDVGTSRGRPEPCKGQVVSAGSAFPPMGLPCVDLDPAPSGAAAVLLAPQSPSWRPQVGTGPQVGAGLQVGTGLRWALARRWAPGMCPGFRGPMGSRGVCNRAVLSKFPPFSGTKWLWFNDPQLIVPFGSSGRPGPPAPCSAPNVRLSPQRLAGAPVCLVLFMGLRRRSLGGTTHRDCQPAEGAEPRSWAALQMGRAGVGDVDSRKLCRVMGLVNTGSKQGVPRHKLQLAQRTIALAGVSVRG